MAKWIVNVRRKLHKSPELIYDLTETAAIVRECWTSSRSPRSDMDALPQK
jgi:metal-dependent amidase/aminoacylase/carboxypeptidase family protein